MLTSGIEGIEAGKFVEVRGHEGLQKLADGVKARGRKRLSREASGEERATGYQRMRSAISVRSFSIGPSGRASRSRTGSLTGSPSVYGCWESIPMRRSPSRGERRTT
jgi:hypothetical protein